MARPDRTEETAEKDAETTIIRAIEPALTTALLLDFARETTEGDVETVKFARSKGQFLNFRVHPLTEAEYTDCRERATKYTRNKALGNLRLPEEMDQRKFRSFVIYAATVDEDRRNIWDNKEVQRLVEEPTGAYVIDKLLRAGEKDRAITTIDRISGYGAEATEDSEDIAAK